LQACAGLVLPSEARSEAFGVVLLEAAAHARPQISTEIGTGTSWVNLDGQTGFVVPPRNPRALAAAIDQLCSDKELSDHELVLLQNYISRFVRDLAVDYPAYERTETRLSRCQPSVAPRHVL
jgi:rhamnosyl/mannosyltransferase